MKSKQVEKDHYAFHGYISKKRWSSLWHQVNEILSLDPDNVLEVGPGPGIFQAVASCFKINVETVDIDPELKPDHVASITDLPFSDSSFDCTCAFQVLEHLPFDQALKAFEELVRVASKNIVISLPDAKIMWPQTITLPFIGEKQFQLPRPNLIQRKHVFSGEHYWEIHKKGYSMNRIIAEFQNRILEGDLMKNYRVPENPYHRFLIFRKRK